jgi:hypothetical protein
MPINEYQLNSRRRDGVVFQLRNNIGKRILIMTEPYPFFIVGVLEKIESDFVFIKIETNNVAELDGHVIRTHIEHIQTFFIESKEIPIPKISL